METIKTLIEKLKVPFNEVKIVVNDKEYDGFISRQRWDLNTGLKFSGRYWRDFLKIDTRIFLGQAEVPRSIRSEIPSGPYSTRIHPIFIIKSLQTLEILDFARVGEVSSKIDERATRKIKIALRYIYDQAPFSITFADCGGLHAYFHRSVSNDLAKKFEELILSINSDSALVFDPVPLHVVIKKEKRFQLWWDKSSY